MLDFTIETSEYAERFLEPPTPEQTRDAIVTELFSDTDKMYLLCVGGNIVLVNPVVQQAYVKIDGHWFRCDLDIAHERIIIQVGTRQRIL